MNSVQFYQFGTAPEAARLGYRLFELFLGSESDVLEKYAGRDIIAVPSATNLDGLTEFGIFAR